jgi:hypothetical protein
MAETLDYAAPEKKAHRGSVLLGAVGGVPIGVAALVIALSTAGDTRTPAKLLFPVPLLLGAGARQFFLALVAALLQYPLYGAVCGLGAKYGRFRKSFVALAAVHACCAILLLMRWPVAYN